MADVLATEDLFIELLKWVKKSHGNVDIDNADAYLTWLQSKGFAGPVAEAKANALREKPVSDAGAVSQEDVDRELYEVDAEIVDQEDDLDRWDANTISERDLKRFHGVGDKTAEAYMQERLLHGAFVDLGDIIERVKGIGKKRGDRMGHVLRFTLRGMETADAEAAKHREGLDPEAQPAAPAVPGLWKIDINLATLEQWMQIEGIGLKKAGSIKGKGPFVSFKDLQKSVPGIGPVLIGRMHTAGMVCNPV
ncbi:hypothetical protein MMC07_006565 [Pseudocyphellaria aurata]|nr:hypothetical protein [Pseudocyphellaria aurata]